MKKAEMMKHDLLMMYKNDELYEIATYLLYELAERHYCIWQTYQKEDLEMAKGRQVSDDEMDDLNDRMMNVYEYIA